MDAISVSHSPARARRQIYVVLHSSDPGFAQKWHSSVWTAAHVIVMYDVCTPSLAGQWVWAGGWNSGIRGSIGMGLQPQRERGIDEGHSVAGELNSAFEDNENEGKIIPFAFTGT